MSELWMPVECAFFLSDPRVLSLSHTAFRAYTLLLCHTYLHNTEYLIFRRRNDMYALTCGLAGLSKPTAIQAVQEMVAAGLVALHNADVEFVGLAAKMKTLTKGRKKLSTISTIKCGQVCRKPVGNLSETIEGENEVSKDSLPEKPRKQRKKDTACAEPQPSSKAGSKATSTVSLKSQRKKKTELHPSDSQPSNVTDGALVKNFNQTHSTSTEPQPNSEQASSSKQPRARGRKKKKKGRSYSASEEKPSYPQSGNPRYNLCSQPPGRAGFKTKEDWIEACRVYSAQVVDERDGERKAYAAHDAAQATATPLDARYQRLHDMDRAALISTLWEAYEAGDLYGCVAMYLPGLGATMLRKAVAQGAKRIIYAVAMAHRNPVPCRTFVWAVGLAVKTHSVRDALWSEVGRSAMI